MTKHEIQLARARARTRRLNSLGLNRRGQPFKVRQWRVLDRLGLTGKAREAKRRQLVREENKRNGLTVRGTTPVRQRWPELRGKSRREYNRVLTADWLFRNRYSQGLTARGTEPLSQRLSKFETDWRALRGTMTVETPEFLSNLERAS